ncbi:hypothetical protein [Amycolatopsis coloradensis]|nr:hypothetical protein [Amycolatopsis coloradensis]
MPEGGHYGEVFVTWEFAPRRTAGEGVAALLLRRGRLGSPPA